MKDEQAILDRGYQAVRQMARDMVSNGATTADILFHANQLWHEFKIAAFLDTNPEMASVLVSTGAYIDQYNADLTHMIIQSDKRYCAIE